ncbi:hypothetical protein Dimus_003365 [Dionaea muscipula]
MNGPFAAHVLVLPGRQVNALGQATNILTHLDLIDMTLAFPIPAEFRYHLPLPAEITISFERENCIVVYLDHFSNGLRFPLHPFITEVLHAYRLIPAQLTPTSIGYIICFIIRCEHLSTTPMLAVFNMCFLLKPEARRRGYYYFHPCQGYNVCRIEKAPPIWRRKFIVVETTDWPFSTVPCTPLLGRLNIPVDWSQWSAQAPLWWFFEARWSIPFFYNVVDLGVLEEHDMAAVRHPRRALQHFRHLYGQMAQIWRCHDLLMMNPAATESGSDSKGDETEGVAENSPGTPPPT